MINSLLEIVLKNDGNYYFSNFSEALIYALIGFLIVVFGILIIIIIIWLLGLLLRKTNNLEFLTKIKIRKKPVKAEQTEKEVFVDDEISDEVRAAIVAAIMTYYSDEKPECEFRVKRIKRI